MEESLDFLASDSFDGILSALTVTYIKDHTALFSEFNRVLHHNGWFIFSTEHPFFSISILELRITLRRSKSVVTSTVSARKFICRVITIVLVRFQML
jgi:SAM-dependent methyltransferase